MGAGNFKYLTLDVDITDTYCAAGYKGSWRETQGDATLARLQTHECLCILLKGCKALAYNS